MDFSDKNRETIFKCLNSRGVGFFLENLLEDNELEKIKIAFQWFLPNEDQFESAFFEPLALVLEKIDTAEKAVAVYQAYPTRIHKKMPFKWVSSKENKYLSRRQTRAEIERELSKISENPWSPPTTPEGSSAK